MSRHIRVGAAGFSFVELLVTIIIAGIAFSLMVPVFVQATKGISRDKVRLVAANVAQDRLEKLRQLDYDELITSPADDPANLNNQTAWTDQTQSGKTFKIVYSSTEDVARATKLVTVKVDWVGPPTPHMTVVMSTVIYRQWVGPTISWSFDTEAEPLSGPLKITATVNVEDRPSMETVHVGTRDLAGRVDFMVTPVDGAPLPTESVDYNVDNVDGIYDYTWSLPASDGSRDGNYAITAVAYSANGYPGNTLNTIRRIETGFPARVIGLTATSSNGGVTLTWTKSTSGDVDHYEVWRRLTADASGEVIKSPVTAGWLETTFVDSNLTAGTEYTYIVKAVDWADHETDASADVLVAAGVAPAPGSATGLTGLVADNSVILSWSPPSLPSSSVTSYRIYNGGGAGVSIATVPGSVTTFTILQDWGTSVDYQVKASNGLDSDWVTTPGSMGARCTWVNGWLRADVPARTFTLSITNGLRTPNGAEGVTLLTLKLEKLPASGIWEDCLTPAAQFTDVPYGLASVWTGLTPDLYYRWTWTYTQGTVKTGSRTSLSRLVGSPDPVIEAVP